jgi:DNA-binding XRE family transcriptional regulator
MFEWKQIEAINEALTMSRGEISDDARDLLRKLSLQIGMLIVTNSQKGHDTEARVKTRLKLFPARLRSVRNRAGLTQEELGKAIDVTKQSVYLYETGGAFPGLDTFARLAKALGTTPDYLLGWGIETSQAADIVEHAFASLKEPAIRKVD